jgi:hypothetical protein
MEIVFFGEMFLFCADETLPFTAALAINSFTFSLSLQYLLSG